MEVHSCLYIWLCFTWNWHLRSSPNHHRSCNILFQLHRKKIALPESTESSLSKTFFLQILLKKLSVRCLYKLISSVALFAKEVTFLHGTIQVNIPRTCDIMIWIFKKMFYPVSRLGLWKRLHNRCNLFSRVT